MAADAPPPPSPGDRAEADEPSGWLSACGEWIDADGCCCPRCGQEPPWGCVGCALGDMRRDGEEEPEYDGWEDPNAAVVSETDMLLDEDAP